MTGLDTNVLIRYLTQDDPIQSPKATGILERQLNQREPGFVNLVTVVETVWVLGSVYGLSDQEIADTVERMLQADTLVIQNEQQVFFAMTALRTGRGTFADALIGAVDTWAGCGRTLTFDKGALRLGNFELI